jgi:hypothetical protein
MGELSRDAGTGYPTALDTNANPLVPSDTVAEIVDNSPNAAIVAIETELGTLPKGTKASVKVRLNDVDTSIGTLNTDVGTLMTGSRFVCIDSGVIDWAQADAGLTTLYSVPSGYQFVLQNTIFLSGIINTGSGAPYLIMWWGDNHTYLDNIISNCGFITGDTDNFKIFPVTSLAASEGVSAGALFKIELQGYLIKL